MKPLLAKSMRAGQSPTIVIHSRVSAHFVHSVFKDILEAMQLNTLPLM